MKNFLLKERTIAARLALYLLLAFCINLLVETMARKNTGGLQFMLQSPLIFFFNVLVIFATLSVSLLFRHRTFFLIVITLVWLGIGLTNGIILLERMTPFTVKDLASMTDAATILTNYFSRGQLALIATGLVLAVILLTLMWIMFPGKKRPRHILKENLIAVALIVALTFGTGFTLIKTAKLATFFGNLAYAYRDYGIPYCFINTWLNTGIRRPAGYSVQSVKTLLPPDSLDAEGSFKIDHKKRDQQYPNILFLQLESFTDPALFNQIKLSEDAMPYFRSLQKTCSSGYLTVPACGAGTANTEFEVMSGISVKFFGPGEYPFKGILKKKSMETIPYDLKNIGFATHAVHDHRAMFYNRNEVFANIGYDTFTSVEYMADVPKTPKNWAQDKILTKYIMQALKDTKSRDYIYTISVQGHGKYPTEQLIRNPSVRVTDAPDEATRWRYEYYVNQVKDMDSFLQDLTSQLAQYEEPVVLVAYGDHIPALDVTEDSYDRDLYETPYVIWANYDLPQKDKDLHAYELGSEVMNRIGFHEGSIVQYQQNTDHTSPDFLNGLKMLAYDRLYGKDFLYNGGNPFPRVDMQMGVKPVKIDRVVKVSGTYYIKGSNFTEYSKVTLNGETLKTVYLSPTLLALEESVEPDEAKAMKVSQIDKSNKEIVSTTE